jgi:hypothetical protein
MELNKNGSDKKEGILMIEGLEEWAKKARAVLQERRVIWDDSRDFDDHEVIALCEEYDKIILDEKAKYIHILCVWTNDIISGDMGLCGLMDPSNVTNDNEMVTCPECQKRIELDR